jgi:hypothetical protein
VNPVRAGFFSFTPPAPADDDGSYLRWHLLDHLPEQYRIPGLVHGVRWIADGGYPDAAIVAEGPLGGLGGLVNYLFADPVQETYDAFMALGRELVEVGRFPEHRPSLQLRLMALRDRYAAPSALVSPEVVPMRPHRGVLVVVEEPADDVAAWQRWCAAEHYPELLDVDGVAGAWTYAATDTWSVLPTCASDPQLLTIVYLDDDPIATTGRAVALIERRWASADVRPVFAGPLRSMVAWEAWPR